MRRKTDEKDDLFADFRGIARSLSSYPACTGGAVQRGRHGGRFRGNEVGLVGYWNFDRDDGETVRDMSRHANDGKLGPAEAAVELEEQ